MTLTILPSRLRGTVTPPPSKSQAHRLLLAAALAEGTSLLHNIAPSQDVEATLGCLSALGAAFTREGDTLTLRGMRGRSRAAEGGQELPLLDCGESGSTLRFLIPVALAVAGGGRFTGRGRLMERPQGPYFDIFKEKGIFYEQKDGVLTVRGRLAPGVYRLPGDVSSQFVTGLLYALPLLEGDSAIELTTPLESAGYVSMTLEALRAFGIQAGWRPDPDRAQPPALVVPGGQAYRPNDLTVEPDWSQAAFWYAAQALGSPVEVAGMNERSLQGDRAFLSWVRMVKGEPMTGGVTVPILGEGQAEPLGAKPTQGAAVSIDVSQDPDLVPPLAAMGALMEGTLYIKNAARLRLKESDRLATVTEALRKLGAQVTEEADRLIIQGVKTLPGGAADSHNDHRIAMMVAVAATRCDAPVTLAGAEAVNKSYPSFWEDYTRLGGNIREVSA